MAVGAESCRSCILPFQPAHLCFALVSVTPVSLLENNNINPVGSRAQRGILANWLTTQAAGDNSKLDYIRVRPPGSRGFDPTWSEEGSAGIWEKYYSYQSMVNKYDIFLSNEVPLITDNTQLPDGHQFDKMAETALRKEMLKVCTQPSSLRRESSLMTDSSCIGWLRARCIRLWRTSSFPHRNVCSSSPSVSREQRRLCSGSAQAGLTFGSGLLRFAHPYYTTRRN
jgi:hypothetical protein